MAPSIWGPMGWRTIHGMAHAFDHLTAWGPGGRARDTVALAFHLFLCLLAWVLPCVFCRESYTDYLLQGEAALLRAFATQDVRRFVFTLHNLVNAKLGKPQFTDFELVVRRSKVWSVEFSPAEVFGLLFVMALNYDANGEPDKDDHYRQFFDVLPLLFDALGQSRLAAALEGAEVARFASTQEDLLRRLHRAYTAWCPVRPAASLDSLVARYDLCRAH